MKRSSAILLLVIAMLPLLCSAAFTGEETNAPFTIHGRLRNYMGYAQMRIWIIGSTRILGVEEETSESEKIAALFPKGGWFEYAVYGDFTVEPLAPDIKGHKRPVRILGVRNIVLERDADNAIILLKQEL
jgi:hypothetical protein